VGLFLVLNGQRLNAGQPEAVLTMLSVSDGALREAGYADWIGHHVQPGDG
jgi:prophage maintenance system killer protein